MVNRRSIACCSTTFLVFGVFLLIAGVALIVVVERGVLDDKINNNLKLTPDNTHDSTSVFLKPTFPIHFKVWIFNVTNVEESLKGATPVLDERGPYVYREEQVKVNATWCVGGKLMNETGSIIGHDPDCINGTIKYENIKTYFFEEKLSNGTENDTFAIPNILYMQMYNSVKNVTSKYFDRLMNALGYVEEPYTTGVSAGDLIFRGYHDFALSGFRDLVKILHLKIDIPDRIGIFYGMNKSSDGVYVVKDGVDDIDELGTIKRWNHMTKLSLWNSDETNMINGTDGTIFKPNVSKYDVLPIFSSDICRSLYATYLNDSEVLGISTYRFVLPEPVFGNNSANQGFCERTTQVFFNSTCSKEPWFDKSGMECLPAGFLNISGASTSAQLCIPDKYGFYTFTPIVVSLPHFLFSPNCTRRAFPNLPRNPDVVGNAVTIDIEPNTGVGVQFNRRLQVNVAVSRDDHVTKMKNLQALLVPVLWLDETAHLDEKTAGSLRSKLTQINFIKRGRWWFTAVGSFIIPASIIVVVWLVMTRRSGDDDTEPLVGENEDHEVVA